MTGIYCRKQFSSPLIAATSLLDTNYINAYCFSSGPVVQALRRGTEKVAQDRPEVVRIGFFGSYARGDWGVGSALDLLIIVADSSKPFELRPSEFDTLELPVPTDLLVYTQEEWQAMKPARRFFQRLDREAAWVYP